MQTTKDIIKLLPFSKPFKDELLEKFDLMEEDQKLAVLRAVWDLYDSLYEVTLDENLKAAFEKAGADKEKLDEQFYMRVRHETDQQFQKQMTDTSTTVDLSQAREKLQQILKQTN